MHGHALHGAIIDQGRAMQNVIQMVFPKTKHSWYLWPKLKNLSEKFEYHIDKGSIFLAIHVLVYDLQLFEEFEKGRRSMIKTYDLHDNDWLSGLYENSGHWVLCFLKMTFWTRMSITQRSQSLNVFFDGYVHLKTLSK